MTNHYEVLGVARNATHEQIRTAYKKKAFQYHPDRNNGNRESEKMFKLVNEAHQVLGNAEARKKHDAELAVAERRYYGSKPQPAANIPQHAPAAKPQPPVNKQNSSSDNSYTPRKKQSSYKANLFSRPSTRQEQERRQMLNLLVRLVRAGIEPEVAVDVIRLLMLAQQIQRLQQQMLFQQRAVFDQGHHENPFRTRLRR